MAQIGNEIGICGISLPFTDLEDLADQTRRLGAGKLIVPLDPLLASPPTRAQLDAIARLGVELTAGEIRFHDEGDPAGYTATGMWELRRQKWVQCCQLALAYKIGAVSARLGKIPRGNHEDYPLWVSRLKEWAPTLAESGLELLIQAGYQPAQELLLFLNDLGRVNIYVDFNPATFLIQGTGDPVEAAEILGRHIRLARLADAELSEQPGVIPGKNRPLGQGQLRIADYFQTLGKMQYDRPIYLQATEAEDPFGQLEAMVGSLEYIPAVDENDPDPDQPGNGEN